MSQVLEGKEECPGYLQWSAFGASYSDSVCSSVLTWDPNHHPGNGVLCDADDDFRPRDVPCPFCQWESFVEYEFGDFTTPLWAEDEKPLAEGTEIHFHDGEALWWTATHPERGEERVLMRTTEDDE